MAKPKVPPTQRFWQHVAPIKTMRECWIWIGSGSGVMDYGRFHIDNVAGKHVRAHAHRFMWEMVNGHVSADLRVLHFCDNARCVNPLHLFLGTDADNMSDKTHKNRQAKGSSHGMSKLNEDDVRAIRCSKETYRAVSRRLGLNLSTIWAIRSRRAWRHVP